MPEAKAEAANDPLGSGQASGDSQVPSGRPLWRLAKNFVVYGLGEMLIKASGLMTMPLYARAFGPEGYGVWGLAATTASLAQVMLGLGLEGAYARYVFGTSPADMPGLIRISLFLALGPSLVGVVALSLLLPWLGPWVGLNAQHLPLWWLALAGVPFAIANGVLGGVLRNRFQAGAYATLSTLQGLLIIGLSVGFAIGCQGGVAGAIAGLSLAQVLTFPLRLWHLKADWWGHREVGASQPLLAYGWPLVLASMAQWVFSASDRFVLGGMLGVAESGRYAVAVSLASVLGFVTTALGQAWGPMAIQGHEKHPEWARIFFGQVLVYLVAAYGWASVGLALWAPELVGLLAGERFGLAASALGPLALGASALATTQVTALGISLSSQTRWFAKYAWQSAALNLALNLLLVPAWGLVASAWATFAASLFLTLAYAYRSQALLPIQVPTKPLLFCSAVAFFSVVGSQWLPWGTASGWQLWGLKSLFWGGTGLAMLAGGAITPGVYAGLRRQLGQWRRGSVA